MDRQSFSSSDMREELGRLRTEMHKLHQGTLDREQQIANLLVVAITIAGVALIAVIP